MTAATSVESSPEAAAPDVASSEATAPTVPPQSPIDRAVTAYLQHMGVERGLAPNTLAAYRRDLARYSRYLAGTGLRKPGPDHPPPCDGVRAGPQ